MVDLLLGPREDEPGERRRVDLFVEYDRAQKRSANREKLIVYQQFLCGWHRMLTRYETRSTPAVVFVCPDEPRARELARRADAVLTLAVAPGGVAPNDWRCVARECAYFVAERDVHEGNLRAWRVPDLPPDVRPASGVNRDPHPVEVDLVDPGIKRWAGL